MPRTIAGVEYIEIIARYTSLILFIYLKFKVIFWLNFGQLKSGVGGRELNSVDEWKTISFSSLNEVDPKTRGIVHLFFILF